MNNYEKRLFVNYFDKMLDDLKFNYYAFDGVFDFFLNEFKVDRDLFDYDEDNDLILETHKQIETFKKKLKRVLINLKEKISVKETGDIEYKLSNKGFTFTPGIVVIPSKHTDVGVAIRLVYWNRFGAGTGASISIEDSPKASVLGVVDYRFYSNFAAGIAYKESFTNRKLGASFSYYF